ncbi:MAG: NAD(P)-dependent oxidoreductase [Oscillospiraceae bacterium]|nr:NAD(P)-dependent oxidoreductase [Oscillospiraceae bacterium]
MKEVVLTGSGGLTKIAIVGSNSYIARNLYQCLKRRYKADNIKLYDYTDLSFDGNDNYTQINILDRSDLARIDLNCDIVFFMIGKTGTAAGFDDFSTFVSVNELGLLNFISEYRRQKSCAKIIFPSTRLVYKGSHSPLKEDAPKEFKTVYAVNKFACEQYLQQYGKMFGLRYCIFRICVPYGTEVEGAGSYGTAEFMIKSAQSEKKITLYGDGSVRRTVTHVSDLCNALIAGAFSDKCINDVFNIGGENYSLKEMADIISAKYNASVEFVPWPEHALEIESGSTVFDDTKFKETTGFEYEHHFKDWEIEWEK